MAWPILRIALCVVLLGACRFDSAALEELECKAGVTGSCGTGLVCCAGYCVRKGSCQDAAAIDTDELHVVRAWVDEGPMMKRIRPAPMGRAFRILKRHCHVTLELGTWSAAAAARAES